MCKRTKASYPFTQLGAKVVKDQLGIGLRNGPLIGNIMSQDDIVQGEEGCRAIGEMTHNHTIYA